ncbi:MAG TPA: bifunctional phosphopantothenoylcysteine decarboxylase/phosphopantothenate--cysteine ligase CoaBC [Actinomycetota bacterium]|nr:bifunctional phosphopantothenoylcysteine decarboxylase/phosphopantothenate--cysteine ligase CoaBC [Actinomycetota bacterium]
MAAEDASPALAGRRVLLGVTGGIAAYKAAYLARLLMEAGAEVQVVMTDAATRFLGPDTFAALTRRPVHTDVFERTDEVLHVRLAHEADVAVVAPATANVLAKLALGLADDLVSSMLLEVTAPVVVAPAMHSGMYRNPATQAHLSTLAERGVTVVGPVEGALAAGDEGIGRMAEPEDIEAAVAVAVGPRDLSGRSIIVTAGPTHEPIDPVRFLGNRSSGKMGYAVAAEAVRRGADVTLVSGPVQLPPPPGAEVIAVETAEEMAAAVFEHYPSSEAVVMAAAVADWRPAEPADQKLKKEHGAPEFALAPTTDILSTLGKRKEGQVLVGFAAETGDLDAAARRKLTEKNLDLIVVNEVGKPGTGFGSETNRAAILAAAGDDVPLRQWTKPELARAIWDRVAGLLGSRRDG